MNIDFTVYRISDGMILRSVSSPPYMVQDNLSEGEEFYVGHFHGCNYIKNNLPIIVTKDSTDADKLDAIRLHRSILLKRSDWTQMPDTPLTVDKKAEWAAYRQQLRDFPDVCDISSPVWPVPPN